MFSRSTITACIIAGLALLLPQSLAAEDPTRPEVVGEMLAISMDDPSLEWAPCDEEKPKDCEFYFFIDLAKGGPVGGFIRTTPGWVFPPHWHSTIEFFIDFNSPITRIVDGKDFDTVPPGTYIQHPGGFSHSARCEDACRMLFQTDGAFDLVWGE